MIELGFKGAWTKREVANHVDEKGGGQVWEFGKPTVHSILHVVTAETLLHPCGPLLLDGSCWVNYDLQTNILNISQNTDLIRVSTRRRKILRMYTAKLLLHVLVLSLDVMLYDENNIIDLLPRYAETNGNLISEHLTLQSDAMGRTHLRYYRKRFLNPRRPIFFRPANCVFKSGEPADHCN